MLSLLLMYDTVVMDVSDDNVDAIEAIDSDERDDTRMLLPQLLILLE